jgi:DnaJ like chaperone protein
VLLVLFCALLGYWLADVRGLIVGAVLGYLFIRVSRAYLRRRLSVVEGALIEPTFSVVGALCKADGVVTRDEIRVTQALFLRLQLSPEQEQTAKAAFNRGKAPDFDLEAEVDRFARATRGATVLHQLFLQIQVAAVAADGEVHPAERAMLVRVARALGMAEIDVARLEALLRGATAGHAAASGPAPEQRLNDAYTALGLTPDAGVSDIKRAYRKLMSENHPDKLAARGLPESMRKVAEERARELNAAYDVLKKAREFS